MLFLILNHFKWPKIPSGFTWFGFGTFTYALTNAHRREKESFLDKVKDFFNGGNGNHLNNESSSSSSSSIIDYIKDQSTIFYDYFSSLPLEQLIFLFNLLCIIFIISSIISILIVYYSNYLINKFRLETKYPKLAKFLYYRAKLTNYYIKLDIINIAIFLIIMVGYNLYGFISFL